MNEFSIIRQFFTSQAVKRQDVVVDIGDDAAVITPPHDQQIVITTDTLVNGVHFPETTSAFDVGFKALAVNLSDLAAMGATPAWITLALTLPTADEMWLMDFSRGLFALCAEYQTQLIGGDLTCGPLSITIQAMGLIPTQQAILRNGAKAGDLIYVTHTLGDAAAGLAFLQKKIAITSPTHQEFLLARLNRPTPRVQIGKALRGIASAAIDISDGLLADLKHILTMSQVGACVNVDRIPISEALLQSLKEEALSYALHFGDDYELCFTVPKNKKELVPDHCTCIGEITDSNELILQGNNNTKYNQTLDGYQHFR
jgi:thiamine-monophosphate kinase